ncbi:Ribosomal large subunit pseudouridine synthase C [Picochlorum sp. SENEW3]|nr:Ribosomal large subunit pseudouridine synthase C [Picochlorum sp. SENEW3]WPT17173.1 Ribosomal large subunit pseudouridine synthase C [Picochlorum sp. SENEW3]
MMSHRALTTSGWVCSLKKYNSLRRLLAQANITLLYEDDYIMAVNKPSGLASQGGSKVTASVDSILTADVGTSEPLRLVHRLDKMCSGVLVLAKDKTSARVVSQWMGGDASISKEYWAIVHDGGNRFPPAKARRGNSMEISIPIQGKHATTECTVMEMDRRRHLSLVKLIPKTGRMHQLRKHCASGLSAAILGDSVYGKTRGEQKIVLDEIMNDASWPIFLHCRQIKVPCIDEHVLRTGKNLHGFIKIEAPFPEYFRRVFRMCGWMKTS